MKLFLILAAILGPNIAMAQDLTLFSVTDGTTVEDYSIKLKILIFMTMLSFLPAMVLMMTPFTRIIIVLSILRQALGLQQSPPNKVLLGIALTLTILIMRPVWTEIYEDVIVPMDNSEITLQEGFAIAEVPIRDFMFRQTNEKALEQMLKIADEPLTLTKAEVPFSALLPAFVLSELKTAFQIGFMLFIPFLVIDLIVASLLMAMGMMMLSPLIISLPFKLMIFVLVDGWSMTVGTLTNSFG
jgi:flagellar biosynthetic protein FliP